MRIKINAEECTYDIQEKVKKMISEKFNLEEYSLHFKGIKDGCIELLYHISEPVKLYLLQTFQYKVILAEFSTYDIIGLHVDDDNIVGNWSKFIQVRGSS